MKGASGSPGLERQPLEQLEDGPVLVAAIDLVPGLHHHQGPPDPVTGFVHRPGQAEGPQSRSQVSMDIPEGDDADGLGVLRIAGEAGRSGQQQEQAKDSRPWSQESCNGLGFGSGDILRRLMCLPAPE